MLGVGHSLDFQSLCLRDLQTIEDGGAQVCAEDFYLRVDHALYHAALTVDRGSGRRPIEIQLMNAVLPGQSPFMTSPATL